MAVPIDTPNAEELKRLNDEYRILWSKATASMRYSSVHVLLIFWENPDSASTVRDEVPLRSNFSSSIKTWQLAYRRPETHSRRPILFQCLWIQIEILIKQKRPDAPYSQAHLICIWKRLRRHPPNCLLYEFWCEWHRDGILEACPVGPRRRVSFLMTLIFVSSPRHPARDRHSMIILHWIQQVLIDTFADVLEILDCSHANTLNKTLVSDGPTPLVTPDDAFDDHETFLSRRADSISYFVSRCALSVSHFIDFLTYD